MDIPAESKDVPETPSMGEKLSLQGMSAMRGESAEPVQPDVVAPPEPEATKPPDPEPVAAEPVVQPDPAVQPEQVVPPAAVNPPEPVQPDQAPAVTDMPQVRDPSGLEKEATRPQTGHGEAGIAKKIETGVEKPEVKDFYPGGLERGF